MIQCDEGLAYLYAGKERADMIKISTMTTTFRDHREDGMFTSYPESIRRCRAAGFEVLDRVGIAFENMVEFDQSRHRFAAYSEEMIALCDDYHCETVGLCWDFGHANTAMPERHAEGLRSLGKRLKCVLTFTPLADEDRVLQKLVVPTLWMSVWLWESREFFCTRSSPVYPRVTQKTPNKHPVTYTEPGR